MTPAFVLTSRTICTPVFTPRTSENATAFSGRMPAHFSAETTALAMLQPMRTPTRSRSIHEINARRDMSQLRFTNHVNRDTELESDIRELLMSKRKALAAPRPSTAPAVVRTAAATALPFGAQARSEAQARKLVSWQQRSSSLGPPAAHAPSLRPRSAPSLSSTKPQLFAYRNSLPPHKVPAFVTPSPAATPGKPRPYEGAFIRRPASLRPEAPQDQRDADLGSQKPNKLKPPLPRHGPCYPRARSASSLPSRTAADEQEPWLDCTDARAPASRPAAAGDNSSQDHPHSPEAYAETVARYARTMGASGELRALHADAKRKAARAARAVAARDQADPARAVRQTKQAIAAWRQQEMAETVARLRQTDPRWMARLSYERESSIARVFA